MTALIVCLLVLGVVGLVWWTVAEGLAWLEHEQEERKNREQRLQTQREEHRQLLQAQRDERDWRRVRAGYERALREISTLEYQTRQRLSEPVVETRSYDPNCPKCRAERAAWQAQRDSRTALGR